MADEILLAEGGDSLLLTEGGDALRLIEENPEESFALADISEPSTLPYGGLFFGMCVPSPGVMAYGYDTKAAIRFRAEHTGNITGVRWWNRTNGTGEGNWWNLARRSGRDWASGTAYWYDRTGPTDPALPRFQAEEADVALIDAIAGSSIGEGLINISNMNEVFGRTAAGADDFTDTQFDWRATNWYGFGNGLNWLPTGAAYPQGSGWLFWVMTFVPNDRSTAGGNSSIWTEYAAGTHNGLLQEFGDRFRRRVDSTGHPRARFVIDAHHEMNQSNNYQVFAGTRTAYVNAMEVIMAQVRIGAGYPVRFCHRPAYRVDAGDTKIGTYASFVPPNIDVLALSLHPAADCDTAAKCDQLFAGTLNSNYYGTDELFTVASSLGKPVAFPEWSPKFELTMGGGGCPVADTFVTKFYNNVLVPNKANIVADCIYHQNVRDADAYEPTDSAGRTQWADMVANRKVLWGMPAGSDPSGGIYHTGDGGDIRIDIESNNASNLPSGTVLRSSAQQNNAASLGTFPLVALTSPLAVTRDTIYHIVIRQLNSAAGTVSIQSLDTRPNGTPQFPDDLSWALLRSSGSSYVQTNLFEVPIFEVVYADGVIKGQGYIGGDRPAATVTVGGQTRARQKFVATYDTTATAVWLWVSRNHTAALDLTVNIRNVSNTLLSSQVLASSAASHSNMAVATDSPVNWQRIGLTTPVALVAGATYYVAMFSPVGAQWRIQAGINGSSVLLFGEDKAASWGGPALALEEDTRRAEYSTDGSVSWLPWPADVYGDGVDLPILLELVPPTGGPVTPPVANPDAAGIQQDTTIAINVLANDSGEGLGLTAVSNPPNGTAAIGGGGTINYTPDSGFIGTDTFDYTVSNTAGSAVGTVTVTVTAAPPPVVTPPVANPDTATMPQNSAMAINVLGNDVGTGLGISAVTTPLHGTAVIGSGGTIIYTPVSGFIGTDTFSYTVGNTAGTATGTVTVTITAGTPPVITGFKGSKAGHGRGGSVSFMQVNLGGSSGMTARDDSASAVAGTTVLIPVLGNDSPSTGLVLDAITTPAAQGIASVAGNNAQYAAGPTFTGEDTFSYRARNTVNNATSIARVSVTVTGTDPGPDPDPGPVTGEYPTPLRTFNVGSRADLVSRYANAIGGDLITVDANVNLGGFDFNRNGTNAGRPIVVAIAANAPHAGSAYFSGHVNVTGRYNTLWGLRGMGQTFYISGDGSCMRRILWRGARIRDGATHPPQVGVEGQDIRIEYCEMDDSDARGISLHGSCRRCSVHHTYFHDFVQVSSTQVWEPLQDGRQGSDYLEGDSLANGNNIGWCYFNNINQDTDESETPSIKHPFGTMHDCHINNAKHLTLRLSRGARIERIRITGTSFLVAGGPDHIFNSVWIQHNSGFELIAGEVDCTNSTAGGGAQRNFVRGTLIGCKGRIRVGHYWDAKHTERAHTIRLEGHLGDWDGSAVTITNVQGGASVVTQVSGRSEAIATPPTYTSTSQGLLADLST